MSVGEKYLSVEYVDPRLFIEAHGLVVDDSARTAREVVKIIKELKKTHGELPAAVFLDGFMQVLNEVSKLCVLQGRFDGLDLTARDELVGLTEAGGRLAVAVVMSIDRRKAESGKGIAVYLAHLTAAVMTGG